jgi:hypothetical protein
MLKLTPPGSTVAPRGALVPDVTSPVLIIRILLNDRQEQLA